MRGPAAASWLRSYDRSLLGRDILGGVTAGTVVVPQAMAYATIAGLPVQVGLYTCMVPMVVYALLGGSRTLSVSTTSTVAALTASSLLAAGIAVDTNGSPGALATLTVLVGLILLAARLLRLGSIIDNISDATLSGIKVGVGLTVAVGQLPKILGFPADPTVSGFFPELQSVLTNLGRTNPVTLIFSIATIVALVAINRFAPRVPGPLVAVAAGIVLVAVGHLDRFGLVLVDPVPSGLPTPVLPSLSAVPGLLPGAFAIAIMVFLETAAVAATVRRSGEPAIDNNQELGAIAVANVLGGFFRAMPAAGGFSQTAINQRAGARTQLSELLGSRGIWHEGWKAVTEHGPMAGISGFEADTWQLFHTDEDRSEAHDLAAEQPDKVQELADLWLVEAKANNVLPLNDLQIIGNPKDFETFVAMEFHLPVSPSGQYTYYPGTSEIPERSAANVHNVSYKVLAEVDLTPETQGVIFAHGSRFGGHALFVKDGQVTYAYNFLGIPPEDRISAPVPASGKHILGVEFTKERMGEFREGIGPVKLYVDDEMVAEQEIRTVMGHFSLCGEGLCIGYDSGDAVSSAYAGSRFDFTGGEIVKVVFDIADDAYVDVEAHLAAAMARD